MPGQPRRRKQQRGIAILRDKGIQGSVLGLAMLLAPAFFGPTSPFRTVAIALRTPGWLFVGIGLLMLGAYFIFKRRLNHNDNRVDDVNDEAPLAVAPQRMKRAKPLQPSPATPTTANTFATSEVPTEASAAVSPGQEPPTKASSWSPAVFAAIEWRRFEAVCEALFAQSGYRTRSQAHGADGGVDIWLHTGNSDEPVAVVQCKHWQGKPVGVRELREFFGVMASNKLTRGSYATTSTYTADAEQFARANGIAALDGAALLALIATRTPEQQQSLLDVAYEGDYWRPTCASCGTKMVARTPTKGGAAFWGCVNFPKCRATLKRQAVRSV